MKYLNHISGVASNRIYEYNDLVLCSPSSITKNQPFYNFT